MESIEGMEREGEREWEREKNWTFDTQSGLHAKQMNDGLVNTLCPICHYVHQHFSLNDSDRWSLKPTQYCDKQTTRDHLGRIPNEPLSSTSNKSKESAVKKKDHAHSDCPIIKVVKRWKFTALFSKTPLFIRDLR